MQSENAEITIPKILLCLLRRMKNKSAVAMKRMGNQNSAGDIGQNGAFTTLIYQELRPRGNGLSS